MSTRLPSRRTLLRGTAVAGVIAVAGCATERRGSGSGSSSGGSPRWRFTRLAGTWDGEYVALTATSRKNIWVVGVHGKSRAEILLDRYDGDTWRAHPLPDGLKGYQPFALSASGEPDLWLASRAAEGATRKDWLRVHHWDGDAWRALPLPPLPADAPASTPVGVDSREGPALASSGAGHLWLRVGGKVLYWDGSAWHTPELPLEAAAVTTLPVPDGDSPRVWVVGRRDTECGGGECYAQPASARWEDGGWRLLDTPAYRFPDPVPPEAAASLETVVPDEGSERLWAVGRNDFNHGETDNEPRSQDILLRGDGKTWTKRRVPHLDRGLTTATSAADGAGGILLDYETHLTKDGDLRRVKWPPEIPGPPGHRSPSPGARHFDQQLNWNAACRIPGTSTVLVAGAVQHPVDDAATNPSRPMVVRLDLKPRGS